MIDDDTLDFEAEIKKEKKIVKFAFQGIILDDEID